MGLQDPLQGRRVAKRLETRRRQLRHRVGVGLQQPLPPGFPLRFEGTDAANIRGEVAVVGMPDFGIGVGQAGSSRTIQASDVAQVQCNEHRSGRVHGDTPPLAV